MLVKVLTEEQTDLKNAQLHKSKSSTQAVNSNLVTSANNDLQNLHGRYSSFHTSFVQDLSKHHN